MSEISREQYEEYLRTEHWHDFPIHMKRRFPNCQDCGITGLEARKRDRQGLNVHHLTYERLGQEKERDVVVVCHYCHLKRHGIEGWYEFCHKFDLPRSTNGSNQACANCGVLTGPRYFNVDEVLPEWLCEWCRK